MKMSSPESDSIHEEKLHLLLAQKRNEVPSEAFWEEFEEEFEHRRLKALMKLSWKSRLLTWGHRHFLPSLATACGFVFVLLLGVMPSQSETPLANEIMEVQGEYLLTAITEPIEDECFIENDFTEETTEKGIVYISSEISSTSSRVLTAYQF